MANAEKTEKPTAKRRDEARKKGQVARSPELASLFVLGAAFVFLAAMGPSMFDHLESSMRDTFRQTAAPDLENGGLSRVFSTLSQTLLVVSLPFVIAVAGAGLLASVAQVRPRLVLSGLKPDFKRVSPTSGAKRIASSAQRRRARQERRQADRRLGRRRRDALAAPRRPRLARRAAAGRGDERSSGTSCSTSPGGCSGRSR